jgi:hypothetical protein
MENKNKNERLYHITTKKINIIKNYFEMKNAPTHTQAMQMKWPFYLFVLTCSRNNLTRTTLHTCL